MVKNRNPHNGCVLCLSSLCFFLPQRSRRKGMAILQNLHTGYDTIFSGKEKSSDGKSEGSGETVVASKH
jgi:hypothetical protein